MTSEPAQKTEPAHSTPVRKRQTYNVLKVNEHAWVVSRVRTARHWIFWRREVTEYLMRTPKSSSGLWLIAWTRELLAAKFFSSITDAHSQIYLLKRKDRMR